MCGCLGSCCGSCAGGFCAQACNCKSSSKEARIPYLVIMFIGIIIAAVLRYWGKPFLIDLYVTDVDVCTSSKCLGFGAVYRVSFTLFLFFAFHALCMLGKGCANMHTDYWLIKIIFFIGVGFITFTIPNSFFDVYSWIARFASAIFLILQVIILIDFAYLWHEAWMAEEERYKGLYVTSSLLMLGGSLTILIFCFKWFGDKDCGTNLFILIFTIVHTTIFLFISATYWCEHGNILTSSVVTLYCWWLCYSALSSDPSSCNTVNSGETANVLIGIGIIAATISYAGYNLSNSRSLFGDDPEEPAAASNGAARDPNAFIPTGDEESAVEMEKKKVSQPVESPSRDEVQAEEVDDRVRVRNLKFHVVMTLASMYVAMLLTNWGVQRHTSSQAYDLGTETVWIKIASQWLTALLYIWSLVAPMVCTCRDWS